MTSAAGKLQAGDLADCRPQRTGSWVEVGEISRTNISPVHSAAAVLILHGVRAPFVKLSYPAKVRNIKSSHPSTVRGYR